MHFEIDSADDRWKRHATTTTTTLPQRKLHAWKVAYDHNDTTLPQPRQLRHHNKDSVARVHYAHLYARHVSVLQQEFLLEKPVSFLVKRRKTELLSKI